jgi:transcription-repair coupling factor (superfamily II helicase)
VSKDVKYKDLGLLIIDEEQKFGVNVKDKLKTDARQRWTR